MGANVGSKGTIPTMALRDLLNKIEYEGGPTAALDYFGNDLPTDDHTLRSLWGAFHASYERVLDRIADLETNLAQD